VKKVIKIEIACHRDSTLSEEESRLLTLMLIGIKTEKMNKTLSGI